MLVVRIGPWRLWGRPDAERWRGVNAATAAGRLRGCRTAPGRSHFSLEVECVAVMIHLMRGAGEHRDAHSSSSHARVAGKPCGPLGAASAYRIESDGPMASGPRPAGLICALSFKLRTKRNSKVPCSLGSSGAEDRASFTSRRTAASTPSEPLFSLLARRAASDFAPGPFARLRGRRRKTDTTVSDRIF